MGKAKSRLRIAIVGSTGLVGTKIAEVLRERKIRAQFYYFNSENKPTEAAVAAAAVDFAFMAVSAELSAELTPLFVKYGAVVIDNSSRFRMDPAVPLVVPEINPGDIWGGECGAPAPSPTLPLGAFTQDTQDPACGGQGKWSCCKTPKRGRLPTTTPKLKFERSEKRFRGLGESQPPDLSLPNFLSVERKFDAPPARVIANPNCSTIGAVVALAPLDREYKIRRVVYSTYQAVSGAGANPKFAYPIENNVLPQIDEFVAGGNTKEEEKMIGETKKILHRPDIAVSATAVRVPVANCHSVSINAEFENPPDIDKVKEILAGAPGVVLADDPGNKKYPIPAMADGKDAVLVGRVRMDRDHANTLNLWTVSDNLRKGAATNAVQILELLLRGRGAEC